MAAAEASGRLWNALIRTHHITSRKKIAKLRHAAGKEKVYALLRSGGSPGLMYAEGEREGIEEWVASVQRLRYKDFQLAIRPGMVQRETDGFDTDPSERGTLYETGSVRDFAAQMERRRVMAWWRKGMGYSG